MCRIDDGDPASFSREEMRRAAKPHACDECSREIPKGERGARRSLPTGYFVQAWINPRRANAIVLARTR